MGLFSTCLLCGKKKLSLFIGPDGLCSSCHAIASEEQKKENEKFDVSSFLKTASPDYTPQEASQEEPVYVFIDVETTGLNPYKDAIVQLSALRFFGQKAIDGMNSYVNPLRPIPSRSTQIHGITDDMVKDSPKIDELREPFLNFIKGATLVGYNILFDLNFLNSAFHGALEKIKYIDVMELAKMRIHLPDYHLETVADYAEFHPEKGYHDSLTDCTATAAVFFRLEFDKLGFEKEYYPKGFAKKDYSFSPKDVVLSAPVTDNSLPLFGKKIVFTGSLSISRQEAAQIAVDVGAIIRSSVSGKTDYLVVGHQDTSIVGDGGMSRKEEVAYDLNRSGKASIKIIGEAEFITLIKNNRKAGANI